MKKVAVLGATGYTAFVLCRLLLSHQGVTLTHVFSSSRAGELLSDIWPQLHGATDLKVSSFQSEEKYDFDLIFLAVPHGEAHYRAGSFLNQGIKVIDLSADFRLNCADDYEKVYDFKHQASDLLGESVYGVPEFFSSAIKSARLVANPGCYVLCALLALYPLLQVFSFDSIIIDAKSGASGGGRSAKQDLLFCEVNNSFKAYQTGIHRHQLEMTQVLGQKVFFSPHLIPQQHGILSSIYVSASSLPSLKDIFSVYHDFYKDAPFVYYQDHLNEMNTRFVVGTNQCRIGFDVIDGQLVIMSLLDNLIKGASGQAIQNMNLMLGFDGCEGLAALSASI